MRKLFMMRSRAVEYLINVRSAMSDDIGGLLVTDADLKIQKLEETERLILDVRAGRTAQFSTAFPEAITIFITDP